NRAVVTSADASNDNTRAVREVSGKVGLIAISSGWDSDELMFGAGRLKVLKRALNRSETLRPVEPVWRLLLLHCGYQRTEGVVTGASHNAVSSSSSAVKVSEA